MNSPRRPSRLARAVLRWFLPRDVRDDISGDLDEVFLRDAQAHGLVRARLRYWRKALSFSTHFAVDRLTLRRAPMSWIDFKLGFRMLVRYPGLTIIGGLAIAFAVAVGASVFQLVSYAGSPSVPLEEGHRLVRLRLWYSPTRQVETQAAFDFLIWRREVTSITDLGVYRFFERNLIHPAGLLEPAPVAGAEISASGFAVARVPALLGRVLVEADEQAGAPPVIVIGYDVWQSRFAADPGVVGRSVHLNSTPTTIVGVMPKGFAFPMSEDAWIPMRLDLPGYGRREGPPLHVFGRLAPGVTMDRAQAELTALGARAATDFPDTHAHIHPEVVPYTKGALGINDESLMAIRAVNVLVVLLLALVCGNVALLMFARAATRESEILVRNALGAGRGRIVMQLFTEALVLGSVAAVIGLAVVGVGVRWGLTVIQTEGFGGGRLPFWFTDQLAPWTVAYAAFLTLFAAVIAGVVPALKVTRRLDSRLRQTTAGGGGLRFGGVWTVVIAMQVALTVTLPAIGFYVRRDAVQLQSVDVGFPADQYLAVRLEIDRDLASRAEFMQRFGTASDELRRRLAIEPSIAGVTVADALPRMYHERRWAEVDDGGAAPRNTTWGPGYSVSAPLVDVDYFDVLGVPLISGRDFQPADRQAGLVAVVNQSFVANVLGGRQPIGRRVRMIQVNEAGESQGEPQRGPWHEIVGVVRDLGLAVGPDPNVAGFYRLITPGQTYPANFAIRVEGSHDVAASRVRVLAALTDPALRIDRIQRLDQVAAGEVDFIAFWLRIIAFVTAVTTMLSLAGIYSVMSFTVARRTREIGIRVALGARPARIVLAIIRRPLTQVGCGLLGGLLFVAWMSGSISGQMWEVSHLLLIVGYGVLMTAVCLLACVVPARRALSVEPTEALRAQ